MILQKGTFLKVALLKIKFSCCLELYRMLALCENGEHRRLSILRDGCLFMAQDNESQRMLHGSRPLVFQIIKYQMLLHQFYLVVRFSRPNSSLAVRCFTSLSTSI